MKRDEVRGIIEGISDEQLDALMKLNGESVNAERAKLRELQRQLDDEKAANKALADESEAKAKESMSLEERIKAMEESYAAKERDLAVRQNTLMAEKILTASGLTEADYTPLMKSIVTADEKSTEENANAIAQLVSAQRDATAAATKQELLRGMPSPGGSTGGDNSVTKDKFNSMSYSERLQLLNESPDTYKEMTE